MKNKIKLITCILILFNATQLYAQGTPKYILSGIITNSTTGRPVQFATVAVVELRQKTTVDENGKYELILPAGEYTIIINSPGMQSVTKKIQLKSNLTQDIAMQPPTIGGNAITIQGERDVQKVSRYTMGREEIKNVPASFGDSLGAVTTMAGIERQGIFGPLAIRGLASTEHRFYVDGIPVRKPQHLSGFHSIINNEVINEIDIYSSAFPVMYGAPIGSVIEFNTIDEIKEREIYTDLGLLSVNATVLSPIQVLESSVDTGLEKEGDTEPLHKKTLGYWLVGARYGYITLFAPELVKVATGDKGYNFNINYYDYQVKGKYFLNKHHALTILLFGGSDLLDIDKVSKNSLESVKDGDDPYLLNFSTSLYSSFHTQSLMHTYMPSSVLKNQFKVYTSINEARRNHNFSAKEVASWAKNIHISSMPNIYGAKDDLSLSLFKKLYTLKAGADFAYYDFQASGKTIVPKTQRTLLTSPDYSDPDLYAIVRINQKTANSVTGGYMENRLNFAGFEFAGGFRADHLQGQNLTIFDPRGRLTYTTPIDTTISVAGGQYSSFIQTNFYHFETVPEVIKMKLQPERAIHRSVGVDQRIGDAYSIKLEGYYNDFYDIVEFIDQPNKFADNLGKHRTRGIELSVKKDKMTGKVDYYGWINYTYGISDYKSNNPNDATGNKWISGDYDRRHSLKMVSGIRFGANLLGLRFQYYSSYPETPIIGDDGGSTYTLDGQTLTRFGPVYGEKNSRFRDPQHSLDIRFSRKSSYKWGYLKWYVEFINIYNFKPKDVQNWAYNKQYNKNKNPSYGNDSALGLLPNFGIEAKF